MNKAFTKEAKNEKDHSHGQCFARRGHAGPGGPQEDTSDGFDLGGWSMNFRAPESGAAIMGMVGTLDKPYDLLLGRKTYDKFAGYWPHVPADNPIGQVFNKANKYVLTGRSGNPNSAKLEWANSHQLRNLDDVRKVKAGEGPDIVLWGSSTLFRSCWKRISSTGFNCSSVR
jgi:dihydrofolate reductase